MALHALPSDPVSDVLDLVRMRADLVCLSTFRAPWGVVFSGGPSHVHIVQSGVVFARIDGAPEVVRAEAGDLLLFPRGAGHVIADEAGRPAVRLETIVDAAYAPETLTLTYGGGGAEARLLCCRFDFRGPLAPQLLAVLPPIIHIDRRAAPAPDWLDTTARFLLDEARNPRPGSAVMISRLIDLLFVQTLRAWAHANRSDLGWLGGLRDARIGRALAAMHAAPERDWTAKELAAAAGLSRSAFADRFGRIVGEAPLSYLTRWRMNLAADLLSGDGISVGDVARRVGYASDAAFNRAFKARFEATPAAFRRARSGRD